MLKQPMIEKLAAMRLLGMAEALKAQEQDPSARELSFMERFGLLVDQQWNWRENQALGRRLKNAKLRVNACVAGDAARFVGHQKFLFAGTHDDQRETVHSGGSIFAHLRPKSITG